MSTDKIRFLGEYCRSQISETESYIEFLMRRIRATSEELLTKKRIYGGSCVSLHAFLDHRHGNVSTEPALRKPENASAIFLGHDAVGTAYIYESKICSIGTFRV